MKRWAEMGNSEELPFVVWLQGAKMPVFKVRCQRLGVVGASNSFWWWMERLT